MNRVRFYTALVLARLTYLAIKLLHRSSGTSFVGMMTLKVCPDFLAHCRKYIKNNAITISGTNGKTTTSGLVAHIFALNIKPFKRFDYAVIESDEAYLTKLYDYFKADYLLVTNLFRDQLDRYGELSTTASFIQNAIDKNKELKLILNADDPLVTNFGKGKNAIYYGFEEVEFCSEIHNDKDFEFKINLVGLYNAYNVLGAVACAMENGIDYQTIKKAVSTYKSIFGRAERRIINGHKTLIQLIKNPTGASEVLKTVDLSSNIVIAINDNYADGRDISWLWDSDFEQLKNAQKLVITSGIRAKDMATRLKYAGIPQEKIMVEEDIKSAIALAAKSDNIEERITILPSYTALLKISKMKF